MSSVMRPDTLPIRYNIETYRGDDLTRMFNIVYVDETETTQTLDTTGWTGQMQVRAKRSSSTADLTVSTASGELTTGIQTDGLNTWCLMLHIPGADLSGSEWDGYSGVYDIELTDTSSRTTTMYTGTFCVEGDVTR